MDMNQRKGWVGGIQKYSTSDGPGFIQKLWADANAHFSEVRALAKRDEAGRPVGFWGAMSDCSRSFEPWEDNFS